MVSRLTDYWEVIFELLIEERAENVEIRLRRIIIFIIDKIRYTTSYKHSQKKIKWFGWR